jgi:hypothetical protein
MTRSDDWRPPATGRQRGQEEQEDAGQSGEAIEACRKTRSGPPSEGECVREAEGDRSIQGDG